MSVSLGRSSRLVWRSIGALLLALHALGTPVAAQDTTAILVLHSYGFDAPGRLPYDIGLVNGFRDAGAKVDLYIETLDPNRFIGEAAAARTRAYLRERYAGKRLDVVVAVLESALTFVVDTGDPIFEGVPVVAWLSRFPQSPPPHVAVLYSGAAFVRTLALAMTLHPRTQQVVVIDGAPPNSGATASSLATERQMADLGLTVPITYLRDLPLEDVLERVRAIPQDSVVVIVRQYLGWGGVPIDHAEAIRQIATDAAAPVYVNTDPLIGSGAVGGAVVNMEQEGRQLAALALRVAHDRSVRLPPVESTLVPTFDWRALRRWGVDESLLPVGSLVRFHQPGVWDQYQGYVVGAGALLALQSGLIAGLVMQRARRRRVEMALRESERHFRMMADTAPVLIWRSGVGGSCDFFNKPWLDFRGRTLDQEQGSGWMEGIHPEDLEHCRHGDGPGALSREPSRKEYRMKRADGEYRWILDVGLPRYDDAGRFTGFIGSALDITDRKDMEESLRASEAALRQSLEQNRDLAGRLIDAQEAERTRIARDLHDDVSQQLAGVSIMLSSLKRNVHQPDAQADLAATMAMLQERTSTLAQTVRHLSHNLHPGLLEHAGLEAALTQHCAEIQRLHGLIVTFAAHGAFDSLAFKVALCVYRVTQEALSNVVRHARATEARVALMRTDTDIELHVEDDGVGFEVAADARGLGLRSIDERARLAGGRVSVTSGPGTGTRVALAVPAIDGMVRES